MSDDPNPAAKILEHLKMATPARIGVGRGGGTRPPTAALLSFWADHAEARDAVQSNLSKQFIDKFCTAYDSPLVETMAANRRDFVLYPPRGKRLEAAVLAGLLKKLQTDGASIDVDVQVVIADGLSALAVEENVPDLYPMLVDGFYAAGIKIGRPVLVQYGRVAVGDQIGCATGARVAINLIGERPGLSCAKGLSAYITYDPNPQTTISSDRTVISNIHTGGTPAVEAGAFIVKVVTRILALRVSGVKLQALS